MLPIQSQGRVAGPLAVLAFLSQNGNLGCPVLAFFARAGVMLPMQLQASCRVCSASMVPDTCTLSRVPVIVECLFCPAPGSATDSWHFWNRCEALPVCCRRVCGHAGTHSPFAEWARNGHAAHGDAGSETALGSDRKKGEKLRYMHENPVKRGLVSAPEDWRWSSFRFYSRAELGRVTVNEGWAKISFREWAA